MQTWQPRFYNKVRRSSQFSSSPHKFPSAFLTLCPTIKTSLKTRPAFPTKFFTLISLEISTHWSRVTKYILPLRLHPWIRPMQTYLRRNCLLTPVLALAQHWHRQPCQMRQNLRIIFNLSSSNRQLITVYKLSLTVSLFAGKCSIKILSPLTMMHLLLSTRLLWTVQMLLSLWHTRQVHLSCIV